MPCYFGGLSRLCVAFAHRGMGQNLTTRGPQVVVLGSGYRGSILSTHFWPTAISPAANETRTTLKRFEGRGCSVQGERSLI